MSTTLTHQKNHNLNCLKNIFNMTTAMINQRIPEFIKIIKESNDRLAACALVQTKMMESLKGKEVENIHVQFKTLNSKIKEQMPELARILEDGRKTWPNWLPTYPDALKKKRKRRDEEAQQKKIDNPIILKQEDDFIGSEWIIKRALFGLQIAVDHKIIPLLLYCISFLVPIRPNDLNPRFVRKNGVIPGKETYELVYTVDTMALIIKQPSKFNEQQKSILPYATVFICNCTHYPLIKTAIDMLQNPETLNLPTYTRFEDLVDLKPCGPLQTPWKGKIASRMKDMLNFEFAIETWGALERSCNFTQQLARSFCASCISDNIIKNTLAADTGIERALGHCNNSSNNQTYLKFITRPTAMKKMRLIKVTESEPIILQCGQVIKNGVKVVFKQ